MSTTTATMRDSLEADLGAVKVPVRERFALPSRRTLLAGGVAAVVALSGISYILLPATSEATDDAYVGADATVVAPKVKGLVAQVLVQDNQAVHAGEALVRIDAEEFDARVETAKAQVADAQAGIASAQAALVSLAAEQRLASANVRAARSAILAAEAEAERASLDRERFASLAKQGAVAQREADTARALAVGAEQGVARSTALYDVSRHTVTVTDAKRATLEAALLKAQAVAERAKAELDLALQDQRHATIYAPIDGVVGNRQVQQGDYVQAGSRLLTLVPTRGFYVTANFKETQTGRMHPGQHARIRIDAFPGEDFDGTVESIAPGSGSSFALLPFEPGTGNFTKIVQRIPVRIRFAGGAPSLEQLRPGLSVAAKVTLG